MAEVEGRPMPEPEPVEYTPDSGSWISDALNAPVEAATSAANRAADLAQQATAADQHTSGPGFAFDHDQLTSIAGRWGKLAKAFERDTDTADRLQETLPPGNEYASVNNVETVHESGKVMAEGLAARAKYCENQQAKFLKAAGEYQQAEERAQSDLSDQYGGIV